MPRQKQSKDEKKAKSIRLGATNILTGMFIAARVMKLAGAGIILAGKAVEVTARSLEWGKDLKNVLTAGEELEDLAKAEAKDQVTQIFGSDGNGATKTEAQAQS